MITAAVICEYNPFHNGHKYQFETIRKRLKADYIICLMSGDFVQRGEPALYSKELRTKWALENGADLVLLLPVPYATGSADLFAYGAVYILTKLKCVNYLCFGSESGDIDRLYSAAEHLLKEGQPASKPVIDLLRLGYTFAKARATLFPEYEDLLNGSNNVLALEYLQSLIKLRSSIRPVTIKRQGQDYNDDSLVTDKMLSASAIRRVITDRIKNRFSNNEDSVTNINLQSPVDFDSIDEKPVFLDDFSKELLYSLLLNESKLSEFLESSEDLVQRVDNKLPEFTNFSEFIERIKAKNFTHSRISRYLTHVLLNISGSNFLYKELLTHISHIKVLGFKESAEPLLKKISENGEIKLISKIPGSESELSSASRDLFKMELFASTLRNKVAGIELHEYQKQLVKLP